MYENSLQNKNMSKYLQTRKELFARKKNVEWIPPTKAAMEMHVKQTADKGGRVQDHNFASYTRAVTGNQLRVEQQSGGTI
jgi:hypothetical protein